MRGFAFFVFFRPAVQQAFDAIKLNSLKESLTQYTVRCMSISIIVVAKIYSPPKFLALDKKQQFFFHREIINGSGISYLRMYVWTNMRLFVPVNKDMALKPG